MRRAVLFVASSALSLPFQLSCGPSDLHATQSAPPPAAEAELEPESVTIFGQRALLFLEFAPLIAGRPARLLAHVSVTATGEPVRAGRVELEIGPTKLSVEAPKRDGLFVPEGLPGASGMHAARLVVSSSEVEETLDLGELRVYASEQEARDAAKSSEGSPSEVAFLMEQQWRVKLLLAPAGPRDLARRVTVPAQAKVPEGASASVVPPAAGRLIAPPNGRIPRTGERVEAGQVLALVEPPLVASDLAQLRALQLELEAKSLELDLRALEVARSIAEAEARVRVAERERVRIGKLRDEELATQPQLEAAEQDLVVARADLEAARASKTSLDAVRGGFATPGQASPPANVQLPLRAPIAGRIVAAPIAEGESVAADAAAFRILDSSRLWIEGRVSEFDLALVRSAPEARAEFPALPGREFPIPAAAVASAYLAPEVDPSSRTFALRYELANESGELKHGLLARLSLATTRTRAAVAIPAEAVIHEQGLPTAYVMVSGETFERRDLELGLRDGAFVEVVRGIAAGEHVATRGAYFVKLAALSPASFGHGHAH